MVKWLIIIFGVLTLLELLCLSYKAGAYNQEKLFMNGVADILTETNGEDNTDISFIGFVYNTNAIMYKNIVDEISTQKVINALYEDLSNKSYENLTDYEKCKFETLKEIITTTKNLFETNKKD